MMKQVAFVINMTLTSEISTSLRAFKLITTCFRSIKDVDPRVFTQHLHRHNLPSKSSAGEVTVTFIPFIKGYGSDQPVSEPQSPTKIKKELTKVFYSIRRCKGKDFTGTLLSAKKRPDLRGLCRKCRYRWQVILPRLDC